MVQYFVPKINDPKFYINNSWLENIWKVRLDVDCDKAQTAIRDLGKIPHF